MATDLSEEAKARRSASARKAAETRRAKREKAEMADAYFTLPKKAPYPYIQNSRVARWALSGVSLIAITRGNRHVRGMPVLR